jgi:ribonuclease BN (tRNA processing enzyme)
MSLESGGATYLFDAGEPVGPAIVTDAVSRSYCIPRTKAQIHRDERMSVDIYSIRAVFISHLHADHVSGIPMLLQVGQLFQSRDESFRFGPENRMEIYMPKMGIPITREYLEVIGLGQLRFALSLRPVREGPFHDDGNVTVEGIHNSHRLGSAFSFLVRGEGRTVAYSGDLALRDLGETEFLRDPLDLLVVECAHFSPEELFTALRERPIDRVVVSHIHPSLYGKTDEIEKLGRDMLPCDVTVARDGMEIHL